MDPVAFIGYAPDLPPMTPGVITNCSAIVPTLRGYRGAPTEVDAGLNALSAGPCKGAALVQLTDDSTRMFAGTSDTMYEASGSAWVNRTGSTLNGLGGSDRWRFAQFGDVTIMAAKTEIISYIDTGSVISYATSVAPRCGIVETANNFVIGFDVADQGGLYDSADHPDGWWCAARGGYTDWVPSVTTEAATGRLTSTPGKIVGAKRFGYEVVAYKVSSMYVGAYVGQPDIWKWSLVPGEAGALSHEVIVSVGTPQQPKHIFMGLDNFYEFDGGRPVPIGDELRETVFTELNLSYYYVATALHDAVNKLIYFYYPVGSTGNPDRCVVYNYRTRKWGRDDREIQAVMQFIASGLTYDELGNEVATFDQMPETPYDYTFASAATPLPSIFDTSNQLQRLTGASDSSSITTGDYGNDQIYTLLSRVRPMFLTQPQSATMVHHHRATMGEALASEAAIALESGRFDPLYSDRWHRMTFNMIGPHEMMGFSADMTEDGEED